MGKKGGSGGGGGGPTSLGANALLKITSYFAFCIFIVVQLWFQLELQLEV